MSNNPQWKSFQPPAMNTETAILELNFKPMTISNNSTTSSEVHNSSNGTSFSNSGSNQFQGAQSSTKDTATSAFNKGSSNNHYSSSYNSFPSSNSTRGSGRYSGNAFSSSEGTSVFNGESLPSPPSNNGSANSNTTSSCGYNDSSLGSQGTRETGIIEKLLHSYGFIQCCERQARLFFHFSQFNGTIEHLKIGDPVEFEMTYDRRTGKPIASAVTKIAPEVVLSEERVTGNVTTELRSDGSGTDTQGRISYENRGECFFLPYNKDDVEGNVTLRAGDKVSFQIATNQRNGNLGACHIRLENPAHPVKYRGVVCSMKESFGFIERADVVKEIFFHFSEAKSKDELQLGDDVEFIILTRNGKEVACNITRLPPGTVVFEDVGSEVMKGQVLKPLERGQQMRHLNDPLPGRIRYRAADHSEVEIPFGDKDQKGDFTLRHGDWVQFQIATDRRDQLQRATNISLLDESFVVSGERREQGVVASLKDGFGFLRCVERDARLFFHFNEVLDVDREICINDEVEFTVSQEQSSFSNVRQSAIRVKHLPPGTVEFESIIEKNLSGTVTKEAQMLNWNSRSPTKGGNQSTTEKSGEMGVISYQANGTKKTVNFLARDCDIKNYPRVGDKVDFNISMVKRNKELVATDVHVTARSQSKTGLGRSNSLPLCQGFIAALKDGFGFIETLAHDREVFFHFSNFDGDNATLEIGLEVEYNLATRGSSGSCLTAENVRILPKGTIELPPAQGDVLNGIVIRPLRSVNPDQSQYAGLIQVSTEGEDEKGPEYEFGITGLANKRELLQTGDPVTFQVDTEGRATNISAIRKKRRATVNAVKGLFGFLAYELDEGKNLFFHMSEVKDGVTLQPGDQVEFVIVTNQRTGKSSACDVTKIGDAPKQERPERLISRLRTISLDDSGPKLTVVRQPRGPDGTRGFDVDIRQPRLPGAPVSE
ncbi:cold shock domain-containing protein E1-like isoform X1 [Schistocerca nitens]|uniref:cold shock domain-containing protein E1-like isoform X1 n=1 Tax=Schistocerca nitens TaxID=7011 RepID=UPI002117D747|nr:cold shock domain-containing protein E1-like isoform X1 [Schistocerca nitens]